MPSDVNFYVLGIDYESASYLVRSRFSFSPSQKADFSVKLTELGCGEAVVLSTCNRSEVYFTLSSCTADDAEKCFTDFFDAGDLGKYLYRESGEAALRHLFSVAAGLKSAVIGEDQILGQVRLACEDAETFGTAGKFMIKIFHSAQSAAKLIKTETGMSQIPVSTVYVGVKLMKERMGTLEGKRFVVIGTGEMSMLALRYLIDEKAGSVKICSRSCGKVLPVTENDRCELVAFADRYEYIAEADGVITATSSPHTVIDGAALKRPEKPLCILDMAMPPDVEPGVSQIPGCCVIDIDQLRSETNENLEKRRSLSGRAEAIISEATAELLSWIFHSRVDEALASLNRRCDEIARDTERYLENKVDLSPREKKLVYKMLEASLHRLIREPVTQLKALEDAGKQDEYIRVVKALFDI